MNTRAHIGKLETQLRHWGATLDDLIARAELAGAEARLEQRKQLQELTAKHHEAQVLLDAFKAAGSEKWETLKGGVESAWSELEHAFTKLKD